MPESQKLFSSFELVSIPSYDPDNDDLRYGFYRRVCSLRDAFFAYWQSCDPSVSGDCYDDETEAPLVTLWDYFVDWISLMKQRPNELLDPIDSRSGHEWFRLNFGPIAPYVFIAIADEVIQDQSLMDYVEQRPNGTQKRTPRPRITTLQPPADKPEPGHRGSFEDFVDDTVWPLCLHVPRLATSIRSL